MAIQDRNLSVGTQLHAKYKGVTYRAELIEVDVLPKGMRPKDAPADPDPRLVRELRYKVEGKDELFKSPSAAGTAITEKACNGWAFWTVGEPPVDAEPAPTTETAKPAKARRTQKAAAASESSEPPALPDGTIGQHANGKLACEVCGAEFDDEGQVTSHYMEAHAN